MKDYLSLSQAAAQAGVTRQTIWRWVRRGYRGKKLPAMRLVGRFYVKTLDVRWYLAQFRE